MIFNEETQTLALLWEEWFEILKKCGFDTGFALLNLCRFKKRMIRKIHCCDTENEKT